jgi:hypothetical protein
MFFGLGNYMSFWVDGEYAAEFKISRKEFND